MPAREARCGFQPTLKLEVCYLEDSLSHRERVARQRRVRAARPTITILHSSKSWGGLPSSGAGAPPSPKGRGLAPSYLGQLCSAFTQSPHVLFLVVVLPRCRRSERQPIRVTFISSRRVSTKVLGIARSGEPLFWIWKLQSRRWPHIPAQLRSDLGYSVSSKYGNRIHK